MKISDLSPNARVLNQEPLQPSTSQPSTLNEFSTGFAKGGLSTLKGLGTIGQAGLSQTAGRLVSAVQGRGFIPTTSNNIYTPGSPQEIQAGRFIEPTGIAQKIGFGTEQLAEYFIPAAKAQKAEQAVNLISKGITSPFLAATTRVVGKAIAQGVAAGGVKYIQTGGKIKPAAQTALLAGATRGAIAIIGEGARALHLPERLYSTIFKNSAKDMLTELKSNGLQALQVRDPQKFADFVEKGIVKIGPSGTPILNDTLAEQALDKGLRGSIRDMANEVLEKTFDSEDEVRRIARTYSGTINLKEPQFQNVLRGIAQEYEDVGFGDISKAASTLADKIKVSKGLVSSEDALAVRRLLDQARIASSFERPASKLSLTQSNFKTLADTVRSRVNVIPGMGEVMKDYSFYIDAMQSLATEAARRGNNQVLSLIDSLFLSGAYAGNNPIPGLTMGMLRKLIISAPGTTALGSLLNQPNISGLTSGLISAGSSGVQSLLGGQEPQTPQKPL